MAHYASNAERFPGEILTRWGMNVLILFLFALLAFYFAIRSREKE